jgi:hypothetical protein
MYVKDMQRAMSKMKVAKNIEWCDLDESNYDRSYEGEIIGAFKIFDKEGFTYKRIDIVISSGYYEGRNIDYVINDIADITESMYGLLEKEEKKLDKQTEVLCNKIKKLLKKIGGEEYVKVAQFSNGECMYNKVK